MYPKTALYPFVGMTGFPYPPKEGAQGKEAEKVPGPGAVSATPVAEQASYKNNTERGGTEQPTHAEHQADTVDRLVGYQERDTSLDFLL